VQELAITALSHLLIVLLGLTLVTFSLLSMLKENRQGQPLQGIIWFALAVLGICIFLLLAETAL
jgi:uncharacterized membrane protein YozB (DUF420 family)